MSIASMRADFDDASRNDVSRLNEHAANAVIIEKEDVEREAFSTLISLTHLSECSAEMESYLVEFEGFGRAPEISEMEAAFSDTIKKWAKAVKDKIQSLISSIKAWVEKQLTKMDENWWKRHADKAFETAASCSETYEMYSWNWDVSSGEIQKYLSSQSDKFNTALNTFDSADSAGTDKKPGNVRGKYEDTGDSKAQLAKMFMSGDGTADKTSAVKLSSLASQKEKMGAILITARADRAIVQAAEKELREIMKAIDKVTGASLNEKTQGKLKTVKSNLDNAYRASKKAVNLVMARRQQIKGAVSALYKHNRKEAKTANKKTK